MAQVPFRLARIPTGGSKVIFTEACSRYQVENGVKWGRLGDCHDYFWTTPEEREEYPVVNSDEGMETP